ncbi:MAG: HD domain-containing phosphohydrolase [Myxococcota bacterium]
MTADRPRLLLVDDEPAVLEGLQLHLRRRFTTSTATSGPEALALIADSEPFAVVMSDMRMPGMNGATLLAQVRQRSPDSVRLLLTGYSEIDAAIAAVNEGQVFRFLTKPCPPEVLVSQLAAAAEQHRLVTAERVLLEQTLRGAVRALTDLLGLASPAAFGRAGRVKDHVTRLCAALALPDAWHVEVAAMLSQIGCITLPPATVEKHYLGLPLLPADQAMVDRLPALAFQLLGPIPRMEPVREILAAMDRRFDTSARLPLPLGARLLKLALDHDLLDTRGLDTDTLLATLRGRTGWYDPVLLDAWCALEAPDAAVDAVHEVRLVELRAGMVFAADVRTRAGMLLIARGYEATPGILERLGNLGSAGVTEPLRVRLPRRGAPARA